MSDEGGRGRRANAKIDVAARTPYPLIIAHRGASQERPENTLAAFRRALELAADGIELDVQLTRDGQVIVMHDERLERTTDGRGWVKDHTLAEMRRLDAGSWFARAYSGETIPTLREVLDLAREARMINVELKTDSIPYPGLEEKVIDLVRRTTAARSTIVISSFNHASLARVKSIDPSVRTATLHEPGRWTLPGMWRVPVEAAVKLGAEAVHLPHAGVSADLVRGAHEEGVDVRVWTVNAPDDVRRALESGVDAIFTDDPAGVRSTTSQKQRPESPRQG